MRQVGDTLVWLGVILVVAAVLYFTPRFASYVSAVQALQERGKVAWQVMPHGPAEIADASP